MIDFCEGKETINYWQERQREWNKIDTENSSCHMRKITLKPVSQS